MSELGIIDEVIEYHVAYSDPEKLKYGPAWKWVNYYDSTGKRETWTSAGEAEAAFLNDPKVNGYPYRVVKVRTVVEVVRTGQPD